jgi:hypothetical protein
MLVGLPDLIATLIERLPAEKLAKARSGFQLYVRRG